MPSAEHDGRGDFDFLFGRWRVHNRRLLRRLEGGTDWEEFATTDDGETWETNWVMSLARTESG